MIDIKSIVYEKNGICLLKINIDNENKFFYNGISKVINNEVVFEYLKNLFNIIDGWKNEYIEISVIDGDSWKLAISYKNGNIVEYKGRSNYPSNFEAFERLNEKLISEGIGGHVGY